MKEKLHFLFGSCTEKTKLIFITLCATHTDPMFKKTNKKKLQQFQTVILKKKKKFFVFVPFLLSSLPKSPLLVVKLFDVKDDCFLFSVFSRDFTKAFGFTLVLSFLSRQKKRRKNGAEKTKLNHGQSPFCPFGVCLKKTTKNNNKKKLVMDSRQRPGCVTIHGKTDFESRKPDLMLLKPERLEA